VPLHNFPHKAGNQPHICQGVRHFQVSVLTFPYFFGNLFRLFKLKFVSKKRNMAFERFRKAYLCYQLQSIAVPYIHTHNDIPCWRSTHCKTSIQSTKHSLSFIIQQNNIQRISSSSSSSSTRVCANSCSSFNLSRRSSKVSKSFLSLSGNLIARTVSL